MALELEGSGVLRLKIAGTEVRLFYRWPTPGEVIETLVQKMPRGDELADARQILEANLKLGRACLTGIGEGDLTVEGRPLETRAEQAGFCPQWRELIAEHAPLLLIALGQHLSTPPAFLEEPALKKTSNTPALS